MVVDPDQDLVLALRYAMDNCGYAIIHCRTSEEACSFAMNHRVHYFIILDRMPGMDGLTLTRRFREQFPAAVIIGMSLTDRGEEYLRIGANDFLRTPFVPYRLVMMIDGGDISS